MAMNSTSILDLADSGIVSSFLDSTPFATLPGIKAIATLALFILFYIVLESLHGALNSLFHRISEKTKNTLDDELLKAVNKPVKYLILVASAYLAIALTVGNIILISFSTGQAEAQQAFTLYDLFSVLFIIVGTHIAASVASAAINWYGQEVMPHTQSAQDDGMFPIVSQIAGISIYAVGAIMVLGMFGVEVGPLLAGLGIAGLAVALALQDSLGNFFAGMHILIDKPVRVGDYVQIKTEGVEGTIEEIGWRSTKILQPTNSHIIIPNSKLASSVLINYHSPEKATGIKITVGVSYDSDTDKVMKVLYEAAKKVVTENEFAVKGFEPKVWFMAFKDSYLEFAVAVQVADFANKINLESALNTEILNAFRKNKIEIPFPARTVYMKKES